jgi:glycosyltransferase involved in cell wall biosynthesis
MKPVLYGSLAAKLVSGVEVVNSVTGLGYLFMENRPLIKALRTLLMPAFRWALSGNRVHQVFEHEGDREYFLTKRLTRSDQSSIIRGVGVDLVRFTPRAEPYPPPTVIMASRLLWDKGVGEFVEAARRLRVAQPSIRFVLVGEPDPGNPTTVPEEVIKDWIEQGVVEWWGHRADMPEVLAQSHLVALPSHGEGIPTILLEAAASGRPIVATDIPGNREVVVHGETGILVPVGDVEALADALMKLIDDPAMRTRMGAKARERAELLFGQDQINQTTLELYHELLDAH